MRTSASSAFGRFSDVLGPKRDDSTMKADSRHLSDSHQDENELRDEEHGTSLLRSPYDHWHPPSDRPQRCETDDGRRHTDPHVDLCSHRYEDG
jgi:hypothetical protein